ncbi:RNA-binding protein 42 isoform X2 [Neocloeon triangulifer]|uniref:RNA-binding protein 42 isoform X2 n=1 Tax=Neocloeon triangulifer TaxID=2078957 RepID=UPI00286FA2CC|nr:RNA-binding protein 42 isoform X2 [Neocloeon triangulifer]
MANQYQMMEAEMSRFEAEIGARPASISKPPHRPSHPPALGAVPPPPMPRMLIPHQVHKTSTVQKPPVFRPSSVPAASSSAQAILSATPKIYKPPTVTPPPPSVQVMPPALKKPAPLPMDIKGLPQAKRARKKKNKDDMLPANVGPSIDLAEIGYKKAREKRQEKIEKAGGKRIIRQAGGQVWEDTSLLDWPDDDFRIFCGDLGNDVTDEVLTRAFNKYPSFQRARVIRDKRSNKTKGFGFVSYKDPQDFIRAMKEMNGRYVGSRPIKLRKSCWKTRNLEVVRKKDKEKTALIGMLTGR